MDKGGVLSLRKIPVTRGTIVNFALLLVFNRIGATFLNLLKTAIYASNLRESHDPPPMKGVFLLGGSLYTSITSRNICSLADHIKRNQCHVHQLRLLQTVIN